MARLTQFRDTAVISHEKGPACFPVILLLHAFRDVSLIQTFIVMEQNGRNVQTIRAGHTILAVVAGNRVELHHPCSRLLQELEIVLRQRLQGSVGAQVVLQMLHTGHAAQHGMHARQAAGKTERPRSHAHLRLALLEAGYNSARHVG